MKGCAKFKPMIVCSKLPDEGVVQSKNLVAKSFIEWLRFAKRIETETI